jgi:hypothetical protein
MKMNGMKLKALYDTNDPFTNTHSLAPNQAQKKTGFSKGRFF